MHRPTADFVFVYATFWPNQYVLPVVGGFEYSYSLSLRLIRADLDI